MDSVHMAVQLPLFELLHRCGTGMRCLLGNSKTRSLALSQDGNTV